MLNNSSSAFKQEWSEQRKGTRENCDIWTKENNLWYITVGTWYKLRFFPRYKGVINWFPTIPTITYIYNPRLNRQKETCNLQINRRMPRSKLACIFAFYEVWSCWMEKPAWQGYKSFLAVGGEVYDTKSSNRSHKTKGFKYSTALSYRVLPEVTGYGIYQETRLRYHCQYSGTQE